MGNRALLHIGFHKTGTTSIQQFLQTHRQRLRALGIAVYEGVHYPGNHVELHNVALRDTRATPVKLKSRVGIDQRYRDSIAERIRQFVAANVHSTHLFTAEGLSFLRYPDEFDRLRRLIGGEARVIAYLRERDSFRDSYGAALRRRKQDRPEDKESFAYLGDDSWLLDYEARLRPFREVFGDSNVDVIDYDLSVRRDGGVIPSFLRSLGVDHAFAPSDWEPFWLNRRDCPGTELAAPSLADGAAG